MRTRRLCGMALLTLLVTGSHAAPTTDLDSVVPPRLVPKGWHVLEELTGDLNRDGVADLIFSLGRDDEEKLAEKDIENQVPRRLVVAFRERGGYRQIAMDEDLLPTLAQTWFGTVSSDWKIERGSLVVTQFVGGGNSKGTTVYRYRWHEGGFRQIGFTTNSFGGSRDGEHVEEKELDANLLTKLVDERRSKRRLDVDRDTFGRQAKGYPKTRRYHLLPVITARAYPTSLAVPLTARTVKLEERADGVPGGASGKGSAELSATLSAALVGAGSGRRLYVRAQVHDAENASAGEVRLVGAGGSPIRPERIERVSTPGGYAWQARYDLATLTVREGRLIGVPPKKGEGLDLCFQASVEVIGRNRSGGERRVLSTARSRTLPGLVWVADSKLPVLGSENDLPFDYQPSDF